MSVTGSTVHTITPVCSIKQKRTVWNPLISNVACLKLGFCPLTSLMTWEATLLLFLDEKLRAKYHTSDFYSTINPIHRVENKNSLCLSTVEHYNLYKEPYKMHPT